ncbi:MAG: phosphoribosylformylglycinamidine synthase subunit PurS [Bacteroidetes bacterium]|nr:phosphoribosylformylglycinamidine synthase subunit PurS [Bacteroidota bacterium]
MRFNSKIKITLRKSILDPQGKAIEHSLKSIGYDSILDTRIGKFIELQVEADSSEKARQIIDDACKKLLANPVMEDYEFEITEEK